MDRYIRDWSNWDRYDFIYYARELLEELISNKERTPAWFVEVDENLQLYAYNELLGVETEHVFIPNLFLIQDTVYRQMCNLDNIMKY